MLANQARMFIATATAFYSYLMSEVIMS